jgi:outer membrane protein assembly factor BamB
MLKCRSLALVLAAAAVLCSQPARADWPYFGRDDSHTARVDEAIKPPLAVLWKFASRPYYGLAQGSPPTVNTGSPIVVGDTIYFASRDRLYSVDRTSGEMKWRYPSGAESASTIRSTPTYADGVLYVGANDGNLYAIDAETGSQKWVFRTLGFIRSHPLVVKTTPADPGTIIFGSDDDILYAIDTAGNLKWKYTGSRDDIASALAYNPEEGLVYFIASDLQIHAVSAASGKRKWLDRTPISPLNVSPVLFDGKLYIPAGSSVYRFSLKNGQRSIIAFTGANELEAEVSTSPIITPDAVGPGGNNSGLLYFGDKAGNFYCATFKGEQRWKQHLDATAQAMPVLAGNVLYVGTTKGFVYALNAADGAILWSYREEAPRDYQVQFGYHNISAPLVADNGQLLVLGDDGTLTCFTSDAIDASGPVISTPKPDRGMVTNGTPPLTVSAYLWDEGSGINPATVAVYLDNAPMEANPDPYYKRGSGVRTGMVYDPQKRYVEYTTTPGKTGERVSPLANGRHTVRVQASDWKGNLSTLEWTFAVDNTLPVRKRPTTTTNRPGQPGRPGYGNSGGAPGSAGAYPGGYSGGPAGAPGGTTRPGGTPGRGPAGRRR